MIKLSNRLARIAGKVPAGSRLADIGTDHALIPVSLALEGRIARSIASDVNPGPYEAAVQQVAQYGVRDRVEVRRGDGVKVLRPGEADCITIAGMGGALIVQILDEGWDRLEGASRLVLQPNVGEDVVRRWLSGSGDWLLTEEELLEEDGKYYEILTADRMPDAAARDAELYRDRLLDCGLTLTGEWLYRLGPYLTRSPGEVWFHKWEDEADKLRRIGRQMAQSDRGEARDRLKDNAELIRRLEEILSCLSMDKH